MRRAGFSASGELHVVTCKGRICRVGECIIMYRIYSVFTSGLYETNGRSYV